MKNIIRLIFVCILFVNIVQVSIAQQLKEGMKLDEIKMNDRNLKKIRYSYVTTGDVKVSTWLFSKDTMLFLTFYDEKLKSIYSPFKHYYKRNEGNDTLLNCKLYVFLYDTAQNQYLNKKPGVGSVSIDKISNIKLRAFYKTPNSYQRIDSLEWYVIIRSGGFDETTWFSSSFFSKNTINMIKRSTEPYFYLYVRKVVLISGEVIEYPILENEKFIVSSGGEDYKYNSLEDAFDKVKRSKYARCPEQSMLVYKLIK